MTNWIKLKPKQEKKIKGGFSLASVVVVWGITVFTGMIIRALFAEKGSAGVNRVGRISWDDKPDPVEPTPEPEPTKASSLELEKFMSKFYEF